MKVIEVSLEEKVVKKLEDIFKSYTIQDIDVTKKEFSFFFSDTLSFKDLDKVSQAFKTKELDFTPETREEGYCETCRSTTEGTKVTVSNYQL